MLCIPSVLWVTLSLAFVGNLICMDQYSDEDSRETLCRSLELSVHLSPFCYFLLQILGALISPDSQQCLLNSANLPGCAQDPLPSTRPGKSQSSKLGQL